jgi:LysR family transcriptional regulator, hypochlorite-specific transcription factor HypT
MELKWLEDFLSLVDTRNFSRSAELRFTTQPAFSRRIKALEEWLGATLFDRSTQPILLTEAGQRFCTFAEEVVRRLYQGREELRLFSTSMARSITFAATHSLSLSFFPRWIAALEQDAGVLNLRLDTGHAIACVQMMQQGACHFMLCHTHPSVDMGLDPRHFRALRLGTDTVLPVSLPDATGQPIDSVDDETGRRCRYLAYDETSAIGRAVDSMLRQTARLAALDQVFVSRLAGVLKSMVSDGRGFAWLPASNVQAELGSGQFVRAGQPRWDLEVEITLFRPHDGLPPVAEAFWSVLLHQLPDAETV